MTDRIRTLKVLLDRDTRDDDVEVVKQAIAMIRGVALVENGEVVDVDEHLRRQAALGDFVHLQHRFIALFGLVGGDEEKRQRIRELLARD